MAGFMRLVGGCAVDPLTTNVDPALLKDPSFPDLDFSGYVACPQFVQVYNSPAFLLVVCAHICHFPMECADQHRLPRAATHPREALHFHCERIFERGRVQ